MHVFLILVFLAMALKAAVDPAPPPAGARAVLEASQARSAGDSKPDQPHPTRGSLDFPYGHPRRLPSFLESQA
jgi:hypothetical protein